MLLLPPHIEDQASIDELIHTAPLALDVTNPDVIKAGKHYLPFSTGFEIECEMKQTYNRDDFINIFGIMEVNNDKYEQRYRIPNGIKGINCLYKISLALKKNSLLNYGSGIHYHVDFTKYYSLKEEYPPSKEVCEFVLKELDTWNYNGIYNSRSCFGSATWVCWNGLKTIEFRVGEMTFDYELLFKRIAHVNFLAKTIKKDMKIQILKANSPFLLYEEDVTKTLNSRITKI